MNFSISNFLRTLRRHKVASLLNVVGLTFAFVAFYIISSQVWYTITYNRSFKDADRTYLISPNFSGDPEQISWSTNSPGSLAYDAKEQFPEAEEVASTAPYPKVRRIWVQEGEHHFEPFNEYVYQATSNVPEFFGFHCLSGDFARLEEPGTVIMARSVAEKLSVGVGDAIWFEGGRLNDDGRPVHQQTIVAVYEDMPANCIFGDWGIIQNDEQVFVTEANNWNYCNYVRFREGADTDKYVEIFRKIFAEWYLGRAQEWIEEDPELKEEIEAEIEDGAHFLPTRLISVDEMYYTEFDGPVHFQTGSKSTPVILSGLALIIVLIAFINFINFFFALVPLRMRSVNIRKVFGASQRSLRWNFLFEAIGFVLVSMGLTVCLISMIKDSFIRDYSICSLSLADNIPVFVIILILMVILAIAAALYPAFYITRFNASLGVKGGFAQSATGRRLRSLMVGLQFTVAMILIITTGVFYMQYRYMTEYDLGFDKDNVVAFQSMDLSPRSESVVERLLQHPDAADVTTSQMNLLGCMQVWGRMYNDKTYSMKANGVRWNFLDFFGFDVVEGKGFSPASGNSEIVITQRLHRDIGLPTGYEEGGFTCVGIIKDARLTSVSQPDEYHAFYCATEERRLSNFYIRLRAGSDIREFSEYVNAISKEFAPAGTAPELHYLDEWVENMYSQTKKDMVLTGMFAVLAIVIALMGVFGIVMFETQHRRAEIAVRKVYGATSMQMISMLNRRYLVIIAICFVVGAPFAWWITTRWLEQFANRISTPYWLYIAALAMILAVTLILVTLRSWKAANSDPAKTLKTE